MMKLLQNYYTSVSLLGGKEQNYFMNHNSASEIMTQEEKQPESMKISDEQPYIPSWRAACDAWVTQKVEDRPGVHTPVYHLYNAYIRDNPHDYMDIGQFGKVLRSRFPYRKRRRGKQGQQVYVYQDVALKQQNVADEKFDRNCDEEKGLASDQIESEAGPSIVVGNISGGRLLPSVKAFSDSTGTTKNVKPLSHKKPKVNHGEHYNTEGLKADHGNSSSGEEKYGSANLCRMAIGRRWIDTNLIYTPGHDTYADEISKAYLEDHPQEPLNYTSLALLIRGKFPGRRKKVIEDQVTRYIYKDLKLSKLSENEADSTSDTKLKNPTILSLVTVNDRVPLQPAETTELRVSGLSRKRAEQQHYHNETSIPTTSLSSITTTSRCYPYLTPDQTQLKDQSINLTRPSVITGGVTSNLSYLPQGLDLSKKTTGGRMVTDIENDSSSRRVELNSICSPLLPSHGMLTNYQEVSSDNAQSMTLDATNNTVDMNVSEYLENELLDINDLKKGLPNYTVSIQMQSQNQATLPQHTNIYRRKTKVNPMLTNHPKYRKLSIPEPDVEMLPNNLAGEGPSLIPSVVSDMTYESKPSRKRSWDFAIQNTNRHDPYRSWDYGLRKSVSPELPMTWGYGLPESVYSNNVGVLEHRDGRIVENLSYDKLDTDFATFHDYDGAQRQIVMNEETAISTPMNSLSITENQYTIASTSKGSNGSPTSSSPPGAAMYRLAKEIISHSPHVDESPQQTEISITPSMQEKDKYTGNTLDSHFKETIKSIISAAKQIPMESDQPIDPSVIMRKMESAISRVNAAVSCDDQQTIDSSSCAASSALTRLENSEPEQVIELIRHHQSCSGLGCTEDCRTLRAAYIHLVIFKHKCGIWNSFYNIIAKHSRRCRVLSCDVEFCHFIKHELHLKGVSVLPMQLLKERPSLEETFRRCEEMGSHDGELRCFDFSTPTLPFFSSPARQLKLSRLFNNGQERNAFSQTIVSAFPDTPSGNAVGMHVVKTLNFMRDLFKKFPDVR